VSNKRLFLVPAVCATLLPLTACVDPADRADLVQSPLVRPPMMNTRPATFECDDAGRVVVRPMGEDGKTIVLAFSNREVQLKSVPSDQGQKYSDGQTVFWMHAAKATLLVAGQEEPESCQKPD
jgi:membrane-bound inhibitor of C-type lysozyme